MNAQNIATRSAPKSTSQPSASKQSANGNPQISAAESKNKNEKKESIAAQESPSKATDAQPETRAKPFGHGVQETQFRMDAPAAREVLLAGEFTEWEKSPIKMIKGGGGVWHTKVALAPGRHLYRFLVDGQWQDDTNRPERAANPFGTHNSVVEVV